MSSQRDDSGKSSTAEERLKQMKPTRRGPNLSLAWIPVVLIIAALALLFWWLNQTIQPDRARVVGAPPTVAVGARPPDAAAPTLAPTAGQTVSDVLKNSGRYQNQSISVSGRYHGRDVKGELKGQTAVTVNDWVLSDGISAIWVTGRGPADLSLSGSQDIDTPLVVEGTLRDIGGKMVLDARTVVVAGRAPVAAAPANATPAASGNTNIQPGSYVLVNGTSGSRLSFRSGPGTTFGRVPDEGLLPDGVRLKVLEGPKTGEDGNIWWRLQTDKGTIGWAVQDYLQPTAGP
ncbi:MAG: SH3 domain-containing protein [Anaerolineae bacterium]